MAKAKKNISASFPYLTSIIYGCPKIKEEKR